MISPELLRRYSFFSDLTIDQVNTLAEIAEQLHFETGEIIFQVGDTADWLYLLEEGAIDVFEVSLDKHNPELRKGFFIIEINPGEIFGVSALLEPYAISAEAVANGTTSVLRFQAVGIRNLMETDSDFGCALMRQLALALNERYRHIRIELAAARA